MGVFLHKQNLKVLMMSIFVLLIMNEHALGSCPGTDLIKQHINVNKLKSEDVIDRIWKVQKWITPSRIHDIYAVRESGTRGGRELCVYNVRFNQAPFQEEIELILPPKIAPARPKTSVPEKKTPKFRRVPARHNLMAQQQR